MNKYCLFLVGVLFFLPSICKGQDVIVKNDGATILAKVLKVGTSEIEYKKHSNPNGPLYTIKIEDVRSINYSNGEIDRFSNNNTEGKKDDKNEGTVEDDTEDININNDQINGRNHKGYKYIGDVKKTKAKYQYRILKIHKDSKIGRKEAILYSSENTWYYEKFSGKKVLTTEMSLSLSNRSDKIMYVDLGNCFFKSGKTAKVFFDNSSIMTTKGQNIGAGVNVGTFTGVLGIGGVAGTLANGVNVGGGKNSSTSIIKHNDRIIAVAPHSNYEFPVFVFYESEESSFPMIGDTNSKVGSIQKFDEPSTINDVPWCIIISYSFDQGFSYMKNLVMGLYVSDIISLPGIGWNGGPINTDRYFKYDNDPPISIYTKQETINTPHRVSDTS